MIDATATQTGERHGKDLLPWLTLLVILVLGVPSALIVKPLGAQGTPADILAILFLIWWLLSRILAHTRQRPTIPHLVLAAFVAVMLLSYVHGMLRPITGLELSSADRGLLALLAWSGMLLAVADGLLSLESLQRFLFRLVAGGGVVASIGILQFFTGVNISDIVRIPGLVANHPFGEAGERSLFRRVTATALHPIEFGIVLTLILPVAFHFSMYGRTARERLIARISTALILVAMPMTVARSAIVGLATVLIILFFSWPARQKVIALIIAPIAGVGMKLAIPGLLGTIRSFFLHAGQDPSIQNRLGDYAAAGYYISRDPLIGRGFFTFIPEIYRTLDNQYMGTLIEAGFLGLAALLSIMFFGAVTGVRIRRSSADAEIRSVALSLASAMIAALVTFFTFDAFAFPMVTAVLFLLLGALGALSRLVPSPMTVTAGVDAPDAVPRSAWPRHRQVRYARRLLFVPRVVAARIGAGILALLALLGGVNWIHHAPVRYSATASLVLAGGPPTATLATTLFASPRYLGDFPTMLAESLTSQSQRSALVASGHRGDYEVAVGNGSLEPATDVTGSGNLMRIGVTAGTPEQALGTLTAVVDAAHATLRAWQQRYAVATDALVRVQAQYLPVSAVADVPHRSRALAVMAFLVFWGWLTLDGFLRRRYRPYRLPDTPRISRDDMVALSG